MVARIGPFQVASAQKLNRQPTDTTASTVDDASGDAAVVADQQCDDAATTWVVKVDRARGALVAARRRGDDVVFSERQSGQLELAANVRANRDGSTISGRCDCYTSHRRQPVRSRR